MKLRNPREFAAAMTRIRSALSEKECAGVVGRSESLVRKWCDPDHPSLPNLMQALLLDAAYVQGGHGKPPLFGLYEELLDIALTDPEADVEQIVPSVLMVQSIVGDLSESVREMVAANELKDGGMVTLRRRTAILELIDRLEAESARLEDAVESGGG